jgi:2-polyprenyl-3-methyl-5-hydroxy-6-metoxy-1,4-benzoquinol methylase
VAKNIQDADNWNNHWQELSSDIYFNTPAVKYRWHGIDRLMNFNRSALSSVKLLDIGCGTGRLLDYFLNKYHGVHVKGTDNSEIGLEIAKKAIPQAEFFHADVCAEPSPSTITHLEWATHATCSEVLEHLDDPVLFLKNAAQFLQKGATLVVSVPGGPMSSFDHRVGHRKHYTAKILQDELQQAGYKVEKIVCAGFPFHNLYRLAFILRGESVLKDAKNQEEAHSPFVRLVMKCFHLLFKINLFNSKFGWTVLAKARWEG